ncbi:MAG TPA: hypothetical protein PLI90_00670 [Rhodocyclaceae bacterium]|nr:hypothetical protein [Rhodocyclaceae bacterium]
MRKLFLVYAIAVIFSSSTMSWRAMVGAATGGTGSGGSWSSHSGSSGGGWASSGGGGHK